MSPRWVAVLVVFASLASFRVARANGTTALPRLSVTRGPGAEGCPDASALRASVERTLGRPALTTGDASAETTFVVALSRGRDGFTAVLRATGKRSGERSLADEGASCDGLADALTTMFAIVLDPQETPVTIDVPTAAPAVSSAGYGPPEEDEPRGFATSSPLRVDLAGSLALTQGLLPDTATALRFDLRLRGRAPFVIGPGLLYVPAQERSHPPGTVDVSLVTGSVFGCYLPLDRPTLPRVALCLEPTAGALRASGRGYEASRSVTRPWAALGAGLQVEGDLLGPLGWTVGASALVPLRREKFAVAGLGIVHDPATVAAVGSIGLRLTLR